MKPTRLPLSRPKLKGHNCPSRYTIPTIGLLFFMGKTTDTDSRGHNFTLKATFDDIDFNNYDGLVILGGQSPEYLAMDASVVELVRKFSDSKKPVAATCHGLLVLAAADSIRGRKCTGFPPVRLVLVAAGAHRVETEAASSCVLDGDIVSGVTYEGNPEFISHFVKALGGNITGSNRRILFLCRDFMKDYKITVPFQSLQALGCHINAVCPKRKPVISAPLLSMILKGTKPTPGSQLHPSVIAVVKQILAAAGVLQGKKCTAYPAVKLNVILSGATWLEPDPIDSCFTDRNLVAAAGW
ncbi:hypothetical protein C1H46_039296 [Malus baccata]|uniref:DJ-1/PfpI domain-containing protein n=1 Tax=Malus baccata TaxID=106549 RepID=A0A540KLS9_MALBA|nr:hypothetical protein C1H46_039296 [Malus baccata]